MMGARREWWREIGRFDRRRQWRKKACTELAPFDTMGGTGASAGTVPEVAVAHHPERNQRRTGHRAGRHPRAAICSPAAESVPTGVGMEALAGRASITPASGNTNAGGGDTIAILPDAASSSGVKFAGSCPSVAGTSSVAASRTCMATPAHATTKGSNHGAPNLVGLAVGAAGTGSTSGTTSTISTLPVQPSRLARQAESAAPRTMASGAAQVTVQMTQAAAESAAWAAASAAQSIAGTSLPQCPAAMVGASPSVVEKAAEMCRHASRWHGSGEQFLEWLLGAMYLDMQQIRVLQQQLLNAVESACRSALGWAFDCLKLVGSTAMGIETPGSDVDVVCFTKPRKAEAPPESEEGQIQRGTNLYTLQRVHNALGKLARQLSRTTKLSISIYEARVPILRVVWTLPGGSVAMDLSINQTLPVRHVEWFQRVGTTPSDATHRHVSTLITVARCMKWWLRQRQIPSYKEGGFSTVVWLLLAMHAYLHDKSCDKASSGDLQPTAVIMIGLAAFFHHYAAVGSLHGRLQFKVDPLSSELAPEPRSGDEGATSPWASLEVPDPSLPEPPPAGADLARELSPATQLLLAHELRRASGLLPRPPATGPQKDDYRGFKRVFEPLREDMNLLPSCATEGIGALMLVGNPKEGVGYIEVGVIHYIVPREGWLAPFLHRADTVSELYVKFLTVDEKTRHWSPREGPSMLLCPCHFVCRANLGDNARQHQLDKESLDRFRNMKKYLQELRAKVHETVPVTKQVPHEPVPVGFQSCSQQHKYNDAEGQTAAVLVEP